MQKVRQAENVFQRCRGKELLSSQEIKAMFETLSLSVIQLRQEQTKQRKEVNTKFNLHQDLRVGSDRSLVQAKQEFSESIAKLQEQLEKKINDSKLLVRKEANTLEENLKRIRQQIDAELAKGRAASQKLQEELSSTITAAVGRVAEQLEEIQRQKKRREQQKREQQRKKQQQESKQKYKQQQEKLKEIIIKKAKVGSWTQLSTKTELDLQECGLTKLPDQIGNLTKLTKLVLYNNKLSEVPNTIGLLTNLQKLGLGKNQLKKVPECIGKLSNLQRLNLGRNQLGEVPEWIGELVNLQKLSLGNNLVKEVPESAMVRLVKLKKLYINNNQLTVFPVWVGKLQQLEQLSLRGNKMAVDLELLISLKQLKALYMSKYQLGQIQQLEATCKQRGIKLNWHKQTQILMHT